MHAKAMDTAPAERRKTPRYATAIPVLLETPSGALSTLTHDLSAAGAFVFSAVPLSVGSTVDVKFNLPHQDIFRQEILFRGRGTIIRVEPQPAGDFGIALAFFGVRIQPAED